MQAAQFFAKRWDLLTVVFLPLPPPPPVFILCPSAWTVAGSTLAANVYRTLSVVGVATLITLLWAGEYLPTFFFLCKEENVFFPCPKKMHNLAKGLVGLG